MTQPIINNPAGEASQAPGPAEPLKKLYRSRTDRVLSGVCGGLGEYLDFDPTLVRIIFIVLALLNGIGVLLYVILAIVTPSRPHVAGEKEQTPSDHIAQNVQELADEARARSGGARELFAWLLVLFGFFFLAREFAPEFIRFQLIGPFVLIGLGLVLLIKK